MEIERIVVVLLVPVVLFALKWAIVSIAHRVWPKLFDAETVGFNRVKTAAMLGWEKSAVSVGLYVAALMRPDSAFAHIQAEVGPGLANLVTLTSGAIVVILLIPAVFVRFSVLENWIILDDIRRFAWSSVSWFLGLVSLVATAGLAVRSVV